ncbi:MAG TPA: nucleotidyltransferase domain-containing protein [Longimicrobium sp.]|nr:nucleotidyltransferase domain-containing protein [Longimicrobium sp.]
MEPVARSRSESLAALFASPAMARLVIFFLVHPGERFHLRELQRRARLSSASVQKELARLTAMGAVRREEAGGRTYYQADESSAVWGGWMRLLLHAADPVDAIREALVDAPGLDAAFVFGSVARGTATPESDLDVFLVGPRAARKRATRLLAELGFFIPRPVDVIGRDAAQLADDGDPFVQRVLAAPKVWVHGGDGTLARAA